ncbi:Siderophore iron transporter [Venturia nashicola]|uniref:Siderophore iron transporter n=1 Tax=Venturia nashicola TaxID=86259 RepID=A0A4Z1NRT0_9PEZI|nr:Siderophore iron transporter [Venturia nashicola]
MHFSAATALAILQSTCASAAMMKVLVGQNNGLTFTPSSVQAQPGDQNHTVTSGDPAAGCQPDGRMNSDFVPVSAAAAPAANKANNGKKAKKAAAGNNTAAAPPANPPTFTVNIQDTNPIMMYCAQAQHCQQGMVMAINPSQDGASSLAAYQKNTANAGTNTPATGGVTGGTLANASNVTATGQTAKKAKKAKKAKGAAAALAALGKKKAQRKLRA